MFNGEAAVFSYLNPASIFGDVVAGFNCIRRTFSVLRSSIFGGDSYEVVKLRDLLNGWLKQVCWILATPVFFGEKTWNLAIYVHFLGQTHFYNLAFRLVLF